MEATATTLAPPVSSMETILLTPEMAAKLLEHNHLNRPLSELHVKRIARQIIAKKWRFNGDTIKIAETGDILDGQHRLWAIIEAKIPVETILIRGIKPEAFATVDTIRKPRSGADILSLKGAQRYRKPTSMALTWLIRWQRGVLTTYRDPLNRIENSDIEEAYAAHPRMVNAVERASECRSFVNPALLAFIYYILANRDEALADRLMRTLEDPAGVAVSDPLYKLRAWYLNAKTEQRNTNPLELFAISFKAINAAAAGEKPNTLRWVSQGTRAEAFPDLLP